MSIVCILGIRRDILGGRGVLGVCVLVLGCRCGGNRILVILFALCLFSICCL